MAKASLTQVFDVSVDQYYRAVTSFEAYPRIVDGCKYAKVLHGDDAKDPRPSGCVVVDYSLEIMGKTFQYCLEHQLKAQQGLSWSLKSGDLFKVNRGQWILKDLNSKQCEATYEIELEFNIYVPGFILKSLVQGSLPTMMKKFADYAKTLTS